MAYNWFLNPNTNMNLGEDNPWAGFAQDNPQAMFNAFIPQTRSRSFLDYWRSQFARVQQDYQNMLAQRALSGQAPDVKFEDYLGGMQTGPNSFLNQWRKMNPQDQGQMNAPRATWNLGW